MLHTSYCDCSDIVMLFIYVNELKMYLTCFLKSENAVCFHFYAQVSALAKPISMHGANICWLSWAN